jgi:outer membrane protein TolC
MMGDVSYPLLEKLIATAKANYPKMKAYDHAIRISELNVKKAKLDWLNLVSFIYLINPAAAGASAVGGFQTGVSVSIGSILQKPGEVKVAKEELNVTNLGKDEYTLSIEAQVQQRYFQYVVALTSLNWKNKDVQTMESTVKDVKYKFEKGELPFEEYNRALTAYSGGVQGRIQAEGNYLIAKSNLEELIGAKLETIK